MRFECPCVPVLHGLERRCAAPPDGRNGIGHQVVRTKSTSRGGAIIFLQNSYGFTVK